MNITVIHGDNEYALYERKQLFIKNYKEKHYHIIRFNNSLQNFVEIIRSRDLFENNRLILVENIHLLKKKDLEWINKNRDEEINILFYNPGIINQTFLKSLPKIKVVEEYKLPKLIWVFLDSFFPGNSKNCQVLFQKIIQNEPPEFLFSLLSKQLRDVYWAKVEGNKMSYPSWRISKLRSLGNRYSLEKLKDLIKELAKIDIEAKTSKGNLKDLLDFVIITKLE